MRVEDYFPQGKRWWLSLSSDEKGGKHQLALVEFPTLLDPDLVSAFDMDQGRLRVDMPQLLTRSSATIPLKGGSSCWKGRSGLA